MFITNVTQQRYKALGKAEKRELYRRFEEEMGRHRDSLKNYLAGSEVEPAFFSWISENVKKYWDLMQEVKQEEAEDKTASEFVIKAPTVVDDFFEDKNSIHAQRMEAIESVMIGGFINNLTKKP
jgi:hypothetical protein